MAGAFDVELFDEVQEELFDELLEFYSELIDESMGPDGETYGDVPVSPGDRIADFMLDANDGVLDALRAVNPDRLDDRVRQFAHDMVRVNRPRQEQPSRAVRNAEGTY